MRGRLANNRALRECIDSELIDCVDDLPHYKFSLSGTGNDLVVRFLKKF